MLFKVQLHFCLTMEVISLTFRLGNHVGSRLFTLPLSSFTQSNYQIKLLSMKFMHHPEGDNRVKNPSISDLTANV